MTEFLALLVVFLGAAGFVESGFIITAYLVINEESHTHEWEREGGGQGFVLQELAYVNSTLRNIS